MKNLTTLFLAMLFMVSCNNGATKSKAENPAAEQQNNSAASNNSNAFLYTEVSPIATKADYGPDNKVQKLDYEYRSLLFKIRYISDRSYISLQNKSEIRTDWQPFKINFYYDNSFQNAEKDIHLLLKDNDTSRGYILFPAFTEEYAAYFVYCFEKNKFRYIGHYEAKDFNKGVFSFNETTKELQRSSDKISTLGKSEEDEETFNNVAEDISLLKENDDNLPAINEKWLGTYTGSFLRLKEEAADPRAYGQIRIEIGPKTAKFYLDSYNEIVDKDLKVVVADALKLQFVAADNSKQMLTLLLDKNKYRLSGSLIEAIVGEKETYELEKK